MGSKISIITATYNSSATIRDTLDCISRQTYQQVEHLIIDGLSRDSTLEIVREYNHVQKVVSESDKGIYDAMNKGIALSSGDIIGILNSDDIYVDEYVLEKVAAEFDQSQADALYADLLYVHQADVNRVIRYWKSGKFNHKSFYFGWMPPHPTFFVRKEVYDRLGGFNISLRSSADYELMLRFLLKNNVPATYLPETIVKMRVGGVSNLSFGNRLKANKEDRIAWQLNGLAPYFFTIPMKPLRKLSQYIFK